MAEVETFWRTKLKAFRQMQLAVPSRMHDLSARQNVTLRLELVSVVTYVRRHRERRLGCAAYVQVFAPPTLVGYQAAEFSPERRFLSALPPCCFWKCLATGLTNLKGVVGDPWDDGGIPVAKFFNHYHPDHAVGFGHPYSDRRPIPWHYPLGYRGYDLEVTREVSVWQVGIHPRHPELPIPRHCQVRSYNSDEAVLEAKRHVDALLLYRPEKPLVLS